MSLRALCKQGSALRPFLQMARGSFLLSLNQWQNSHSAEGKHDLLPDWVLPAACSFQRLERAGLLPPAALQAPGHSSGLADLTGTWKAGDSDFKGALRQQHHKYQSLGSRGSVGAWLALGWLLTAAQTTLPLLLQQEAADDGGNCTAQRTQTLGGAWGFSDCCFPFEAQ